MPDSVDVPQASPDVPVRLEVLTRLSDDEVAAVGMLVEQVTEADGVRPLDEHVSLHLRYGGDVDVRHLLVWAPEPDRAEHDRLVGYAHLDVTDQVAGSSAELAVHPAFRRHGLGRRLVQQLLDESPDGRLRLWAHGEHAAAGRLAAGAGFDRVRVLWQLRRSLYAPLPSYTLPEGILLRPFRPGEDDENWVALNREAFTDLPDQASWTLADLHVRMREPWFDPEGFLVAERHDEDGVRMVGFHWTKVHGGGADAAHAQGHEHHDRHHHGDDGAENHGHDPIGEVYVVGVDPRERGRGLGRALTLAGLAHLRAAGLPDAMLYVDASNTPALDLYRTLGFAHWDTDVMYSKRVG